MTIFLVVKRQWLILGSSSVLLGLVFRQAGVVDFQCHGQSIGHDTRDRDVMSYQGDTTLRITSLWFAVSHS
jgi:hypothetical protein